MKFTSELIFAVAIWNRFSMFSDLVDETLKLSSGFILLSPTEMRLSVPIQRELNVSLRSKDYCYALFRYIQVSFVERCLALVQCFLAEMF